MPPTSALSLRISEADRKLIDRAAQATHKTRTEFLLDSARAAAADALLDRNLFLLSPPEFKAFEKALARAPSSTGIASKLRKRASPWKR